MATDRTTTNPATSESATALEQNRWWQLAVALAGAFIILLDSTIVNVAMVSIQRDLGASYAAIEWVLSGYALAYGLLLIPAGRLGDRFGRKRLFLIGLAGFTVTSALCGLANSPETLIGWRVLQGAMAGLLNPAILAIIQTIFQPRERGKAFGAYGAVSGLAVALGPLLGGLLIAGNLGGRSWQPIFWINIPIGIVTLLFAIAVLKESFGRAGAIDWVGIALVSAAVLFLVFPLVEGRSSGWPPWTFVLLAAALPMFGLFAWWEARRMRRNEEPLIDLRLFRGRAFAAGIPIGLAFFAGFIGLIFALSIYLQAGLTFSALQAGLTLLPWALGSFAGAAFSDAVASRMGRSVLALGAGMVAVSIVALVLIVRWYGIDVSAWAMLPALVIGGIGSGFVIAPNVDIVLEHVPGQDAGAAGGVLNTAQRTGQALGVAVVGVVLFTSLGLGARAAAEAERPVLVAQLGVTAMPPAAIEPSSGHFVECFATQANSADPFAAAPGCPEAVPGDPIDDAFGAAATRALKHAFTDAFEKAALTALAAVVVTFLLVFLIPAERNKPAWEQG